jgi:O-antigen/teichoic acid export membrane protein
MIVNVKHSVVSIAGVVLSQAANFIAVILIGKFCGPSELGYFSQLNAIGLFAGSVLGLRLEVACMAADKTLAVRALVSSSCVAMAIALLLAAVAVVSGEQKYLTVVVLASGVFLQQALSSALASERKYVSIAVQRAFPNVAFAVAFVALMMLARHPWSGPDIFAVYSFVFFASAAVPLAGYLFTSR